MATCPKCRERMSRGYLYAPDSGARVKWVDGEPSWKAMLGFGLNVTELAAQRCVACGYVEFFADPSVKPVDTVASVVEENEQLRNLVSKLSERLATLEAIVVDPAERTTREIERLRLLSSEEAGKS